MKKINIKKYLKIFCIAIIGLFTLNFMNTDVSAATRGFAFRAFRLNGQIRWKFHMKSSGLNLNGGKFISLSDGVIAFCIEPGLEALLVEDGNYNINTDTSSFGSITGYSDELLNDLELISFYGFGYNGDTSDEMYLATQFEIWHTIDPNVVELTSGDYDVVQQKQLEIRNRVKQSKISPSFNMTTETVVLGETIEIKDTNNVVSSFSVNSCSNCTATIEGNTLKITPKTTGTAKVSLVKNVDNDSSGSILYTQGSYQKLMTLKDPHSFEAFLNLNVIGGKIQIKKVDSDNDSTTPQGEATLIGAKYNVIDSKGKVVDTLTIGNDSTATTKNLPLGTYKIKEVSPSTGYYLNTTEYKATVESGNTVYLTVEEEVIKNYISILKQYDYVDGNTTFLNAEQNIVFEIFDSKGNKYNEIKTDKNGYASIDLPYGTWKFHQVNSTTGFEKIYDFFVVVDNDSEKEQYYNILNNKISAYLQIIKKDSETNKTIKLENTTFKILNTDTSQYVSQYVGGKVYDTFITDENGISTTYLKLESGNYKIVEVKSPSGYLISKEGIEFSISDDTKFNYTTYGPFVVVEFFNTPIKGQVEIFKEGESFIVEDNSFKYDKTSLENIKFNLYADEDIKSPDGNYLYYNKGDLVEVLTTNSDGYAISKKIPLGKYYLVEVETKNQYVLDTTEYHFELKAKDNKTAIVYDTYKALNYLKKGSVEFTKTDLATSEPIPNTLIEIYTEKDELIYSGKTDDKGQIKIDNLSVGKYYILEKEAVEGYLLNTEKVYFEIKDNGEIVKANMTNKPITGTLEFTKTDLSTSEPIPNTLIEIYTEKDELVYSGKTDDKGQIIIEELKYGKYYIKEVETAHPKYVLNPDKMYFEIKTDGEIIKCNMENKLVEGILKFIKIDLATSEPIPNTLIEIYTEKDELVYSGKTDDEGQIIIEKLGYGKYYIIEKETSNPDYVLNTEKIYFEIIDDNKIVEAIMTNEKVIVEVPDTLSKEPYKIYIISFAIALMGISILLYGKMKRK